VPNILLAIKGAHSFVEDGPTRATRSGARRACDSTYFNCETKAKCKNGGMVDRIVFVTQQGDYLTPRNRLAGCDHLAIATFKVKPHAQACEL